MPRAATCRCKRARRWPSWSRKSPTPRRPALEFVLDGDIELRELEQALAIEVHDAAWFEAQHRFEAIDGYAAPARAAQLLNGLGFAPTICSARSRASPAVGACA